MDIATLIGVITGAVLVIGAIVAGPGASTFLHIPSLMITVGGTIAATLINFPLGKVLGVFAVVKKTLLHSADPPVERIRQIVSLSRLARSEGLLALEDRVEEINDPLFAKALQLVVDGTEPQIFRDIMAMELVALRARHRDGKKVLEAMGAFAPAFGMIGTLIGLVQMLRNLTDPSGIGRGMATALLTTFYGSLMANLIFLPIAGKLETRSNEETLLKEMMIEGIAAIQAGDNPRLIEEKLKSFLAPKTRSEAEAQRSPASAASVAS